jgi:lipopolysaccharide biosynthesis regulator YciM
VRAASELNVKGFRGNEERAIRLHQLLNKPGW